MAREPSLDATLQASRPAPGGRRWVGYLSPVVGLPPAVRARGDLERLLHAPAAPGGDWTVRGDFGIARGDGGLPAPAAFEHAVMGGFRVACRPPRSTAWRARPTSCSRWRDRSSTTVRSTAGRRAPPGARPRRCGTTSCGPTSAGGALELADLRGAGAAVVAAPGETATVPFTLRSVGPDGPAYALGAATRCPARRPRRRRRRCPRALPASTTSR